MSSEVEIHVTDLLPGYVLDILTDDELTQVAEHLPTCQSCREEYARLQHVADDLPLALHQNAPAPRVKDKLLGSIRAQGMKTTPPSRRPFWQGFGRLLKKRLPAFGLALVVVLALGNLLLFRQLNLTSRQVGTPMQVVSLANTENSPGSVGTLVMDTHGIYGTLVVDNLPALDANNQYQVWLIKDGTRTSGGVFSVNPEGYASLEIHAPIPLSQYQSIGVTLEPAGGSPAPTGDKMLGGNLVK